MQTQATNLNATALLALLQANAPPIPQTQPGEQRREKELNRRFKADKIFLFPFLVLGWLWVLNVRFGVDPILNPELLPSGTLFYTALAVLAFYTLGTWMERQANVQYGEVQQKLRSYVDEDYV